MYPLSTEHAASEQLLDSLARFQYIAAELRDVLVLVCWITGICKFKKTEGEEGATAVSTGSSTSDWNLGEGPDR